MIISSILDTDFYKFTMQQAVWKLFPEVQARYELIFRSPVKFSRRFFWQLDEELRQMSKFLKASKLKAKQLQTAGSNFWEQIKDDMLIQLPDSMFSDDYLEMFENYEFDLSEVQYILEEDQLRITIKGPWWRTILWEVPLMAMISELYYLDTLGNHKMYELEQLAQEATVNKAHGFEKLNVDLYDFGTRRRFSKRHQQRVLEILSSRAPNAMRGTSNVAMYYSAGVRPAGTNAHEWYMFHAAKYGYKLANLFALVNWAQVYDGRTSMKTALTDTYTSRVFFENNPLVPEVYSKLRHDSGDFESFLDRVLRISRDYSSPTRKLEVLFSDSLDLLKVSEIERYLGLLKNNGIKASYGIGTWLTNDIPDVDPLNMVIKLTGVKLSAEQREWTPTVKLSDTEGKALGPEEEIKRCKQELEISC